MVKLARASGLSAKGSQYIILIGVGTRGAKGAVAPKGFTKLRCHTLKAHATQTHNIIAGSQHMHRDYYSNERDSCGDGCRLTVISSLAFVRYLRIKRKACIFGRGGGRNINNMNVSSV